MAGFAALELLTEHCEQFSPAVNYECLFAVLMSPYTFVQLAEGMLAPVGNDCALMVRERRATSRKRWRAHRAIGGGERELQVRAMPDYSEA